MDSKRACRRVPAGVSASWLTPRVDFTEHRATEFRMGQPQVRNFLMVAEDMDLVPEYVMRDNDAKFSAQFDEVLKSSGAIVKRNTPLSPNLRAHVERFIQTLKFECLNKFVIVAEKHLDHICRIWSRHYNEERPHSSRDHLPPDFTVPPEEVTSIRLNDIVCTTKLGGVVCSYSRRAA